MSIDAFEVGLKQVLKWEGGLSDVAADPGGLTKYGISIKFAGSIHLDLDRDGKTTKADIHLITPAIARDIYNRYFWLKSSAHDLPDSWAVAHFDAAVNLGPGRAVRMLQKGLNMVVRPKIAVDGGYGQKTAAAVDAAMRAKGERAVLQEMLARRGEWYAGLDTLDDTFGLGWMRRLVDTSFLSFTLLKQRD